MHSTDNATAPSATERAVASFARFWGEIAGVSPRGSVEESGGATILTTGLSVPAFNGVFGFDPSVSADAVLAAIDDLAGRGLLWNVQLRPGYPSELDDAFADRGLAVAGSIPFMITSSAVPLPEPTGVDLREVATHRDIESTLDLLERGFEMPAAVTRGEFPIAAFFLPGVTTWLASVGEEDVSTALAATSDGVVGVYNVATPESHRGRGYGTTTTAAAMRTGFEAGADVAYLQSSPMGFPIYERLGFATVERWTQWMPKEYLEPAAAS